MLPFEQAAAAAPPAPAPAPPPPEQQRKSRAAEIQKKHAEKLTVPFSPGPSHFGTLLAF